MNEDGSGENLSRRNVLKKGALGTSIGITGLSQPVFAKEDTDDDELTRIERSAEVQSVLAELGYEKIPHRETAETKSFQGSVTMSLTEVDFGFGTLKVGEFSGETSASFAFTADSDSESRSRSRDGSEDKLDGSPIPDEYSEIPSGTDAWLIGSESEAVFVRTGTDAERDAVLSNAPAKDIETTLVYTRSDTDGFYVDILDPEEALQLPENADVERQSIDTDDREFLRYKVPVTSGAGSVAVQSGEVQTQAISAPAKEIAKEALQTVAFESLEEVEDGCGAASLDCALGVLLDIPSCMRCAPACTAGMGISGGVICLLCVFGICSWLLTGMDCAEAVDCLTD